MEAEDITKVEVRSYFDKQYLSILSCSNTFTAKGRMMKSFANCFNSSFMESPQRTFVLFLLYAVIKFLSTFCSTIAPFNGRLDFKISFSGLIVP